MGKLCQLFFLAASLSAAQPTFTPANETPIAEALPEAFNVVVSDVNQDGRPDLLVSARDAIVVLLNAGDSRFEPGRSVALPAGCGAPNIRVADFDNDGLTDLAAYCYQSGLLLTFRGDGAGGFQLAGSLTTKAKAMEARGIVAADLNQDGVLDLAIGQPGNVTLLLGNGDATFREADALPIRGSYEGGRPAAIVSADFNGDGIPDLATANLVYNDDFSILLGAGGGKFREETKLPQRCRAFDIAAVDFNRDGVTDLAVACENGLVLLTGKGDGSFSDGPKLLSQDRALSVAAADLNGDGLPDFVLGNYYGGRISIVLQQADGTLQALDPVQSIGDVFSVALSDLNGDGLPDLAAASRSGSSALFAAGRGNGEFESPTYFGTSPASAFPIQAADLDADGRTDLVVLAEARKSIHLLRGGTGPTSVIRRDDYPADARVADFNGDGIPDLALVTVRRWTGRLQTDFGAAVKVLLGQPQGGFAPEITTDIDQCNTIMPPVSPSTSSCISYSEALHLLRLGVGDFTGDGIPDLVLLNEPLNQIQIYAGNGDGSFRLAQAITDYPLTFTSADFNGDGIADLAVAVKDRVTVSVLAGSKDGGLAEIGRYQVCSIPSLLEYVAAGDFNGDGKPDLVLSCGMEIDVLLNAGDGTFQEARKTAAEPPMFFGLLAVADLNSDGKDDLLTVSQTGLVSLLSNGDGTFSAPVALPARLRALSVAAADFNGDGKPEIAVFDALEGKLKILANEGNVQSVPGFLTPALRSPRE